VGGFHTNIGGGSWIGPVEECNLENLSTIAFSWMLDQIKGHVSANEQVISQEQIDREDKERSSTRSKGRQNWSSRPQKLGPSVGQNRLAQSPKPPWLQSNFLS
jgi:hypothetical protein